MAGTAVRRSEESGKEGRTREEELKRCCSARPAAAILFTLDEGSTKTFLKSPRERAADWAGTRAVQDGLLLTLAGGGVDSRGQGVTERNCAAGSGNAGSAGERSRGSEWRKAGSGGEDLFCDEQAARDGDNGIR